MVEKKTLSRSLEASEERGARSGELRLRKFLVHRGGELRFS